MDRILKVIDMKLILSFLLCLMIAFPAFATADGPDTFKVQVQDIDIYKAPATTAPVIGRIPVGTDGLRNMGCTGMVSFSDWNTMSPAEKIVAKNNVWCKISYAQQTGWVQNKNLAEGTLTIPPNFQCAKAATATENLICTDPALAALDQKLEDVYTNAAHAAASLGVYAEPSTRHLSKMQDSWRAGRDACWQFVEHKEYCLRISYERRISYLQAKWQLIPPRSDLAYYQCKQAPKKELSVTFFDAVLPAARIVFGDTTDVFVAAPAASGMKYMGEYGTLLWTKGKYAQFEWRGQKMNCKSVN